MEIKSVTFAHQRFTVCTVDVTQEALSLFWQDEAGKPFQTFSTLDRWLSRRKQRLAFAMNAGMFEMDFSPVGLYIEKGKRLRPLNRRDGVGNFYLKPNGVFALAPNEAFIMESSRFPTSSKSPFRLATQSGPLLLQGGAIHPAFRAGSSNRQMRNGVGIVSGRQTVFAISEEPVNFYDFAQLFRDRLHCQDALYLDGYISSLFAPTLHRNDSQNPLGPIIAVVVGV